MRRGGELGGWPPDAADSRGGSSGSPGRGAGDATPGRFATEPVPAAVPLAPLVPTPPLNLATASRPTWERLPPALRLAALGSACFLLIAAAAYVLGVIVVRLAPLSLALAVTLFLAALLHPVHLRLRRLRLPASVAALGAVLVLLVAVAGPVMLAWNLAVDQFADLTNRLGEGANRVRDALTSGFSPLTAEQLDRLAASARSALARQSSRVTSGVRTAAEALGAAVLVVVLVFFTLKDGHRIWDWIRDHMPDRTRPAVDAAGAAAWQTLTRYVRGTVAIAAIDAVGIGAALLVLRVPLALPLALIVFLGAFIPILGATVAGSIAVLVALAAKGPVTALLVAVAVIAVQQLEGNLLEPLIMKRQVRLHPVVVLVAVTAGALAWGVAGAFLAVPLVAVAHRATGAVTALRKPAPPPGVS